MVAIQILILGILLGVVPVIVGSLFVNRIENRESVLFGWISGQIVLWAAFLGISVPLILLEKSFSLLCLCFSVLLAVLVAVAFAALLMKRKKAAGEVQSREKNSYTKAEYVQWIPVAVLLLLQLILTVFMAYEEGDDAYYIAVSTITESADTMYRSLPYTGMSTGLDARHGLAPFPIWIAYLARMSGMPAVTVGQIALPLVLLTMAYGIYYLIANQLFADKRKNIPLFMILVEVLFLFGGYSVYSAENFLLVRASQGKAVIANIVIPFLFYLLLLLLEALQKQGKTAGKQWLLLAFTMMAGCLCSTMGTVLTCILLGAAGICTAVSYRKWRILIPMVLCCAVPAGMALLYFVLK